MLLHRPSDGSNKPRPRARVAVGRMDAVAKALGLAIGVLLGFVVLSLARMPGSLERQAEIDRYNSLRAEAWIDVDQP